jgi:hypothetical protein
MGIDSEALADKRVAESLRSKIIARSSRLVGVFAVGYASYLFARGVGPIYDTAIAIPALGFLAGGIRLGVERGAAIERMDQRAQFAGKVVVGIGDERREDDKPFRVAGITGGPIAEVIFAGAAGLAIGHNYAPDSSLRSPLEIVAPIVAASTAAYAEAAIQLAGRSTEVQPRLHNLLHLN